MRALNQARSTEALHELPEFERSRFSLDSAPASPVAKTRKSAEKHDVSQAEAEQVFFNEPLLIVEDVSHSSYEIRLHALGQTDAGRLLHVSFTLRGNDKLIRVIFARTMHRKERLRYEQEA
jgi:uncharacterized protein